MEDIVQAGMAGNIAEAIRTIEALNKKLKELTVDASGWILNVEADVLPIGHVVLKFSKPNNQGFRLTLTGDDIEYNKSDIEGLVQTITNMIYERLYKQQIRDTITKTISNSVLNAAKINSQ